MCPPAFRATDEREHTQVLPYEIPPRNHPRAGWGAILHPIPGLHELNLCKERMTQSVYLNAPTPERRRKGKTKFIVFLSSLLPKNGPY